MSNIDLKEKIVAINQHLILNAFNLNDPGLFRGKMGIILYFYIFSRYSHEKIYEDFASELLLDLFEEINIHIPFFFDDGLCGIGWGIEFLAQNEYIQVDTNEILSDVDQLVMQIDPARLIDDSMEKGLLGLVNYVTARLTSIARNNTIPFDSLYLKNLYDIVIDKNQISTLYPVLKKYINYFRIPYFNKVDFESLPINFAPEIADINKSNISTYPLGIEKGLSGACLKEILWK